ncbi:MAG: glycosyltransferase family 2 protein [Chthoniobacterales bacterium]
MHLASGAGTTPARPAPAEAKVEVSVVLPCLDEAETVGICVQKARAWIEATQVRGEVIVADNGSTDSSARLAREAGARVISVPEKGYGSSLMAGINAAAGELIIVADADDSYDLSDLEPFMVKLRAGYDLVIGNRFRGGIKPGAMPALHRYLGNPLLSSVGRLFFHSACGDFHCGLRGFRKAAIEKLDLQTTGMEFASEMVVKAALHGLRVAEVPVILSPAGRTRRSHLRSWRDGWRHLRFLLLYSPRWLFFYPGLGLMIAGLIAGARLLRGPVLIENVAFDVQTLLYAAIAVLAGFQAITFAVFMKAFGMSERLLPRDEKLTKFLRSATLEGGVLIGALLFVAGLGGSIWAVLSWSSHAFGPLDTSKTLRIIVPSATALMLGLQIIFSSFFLSVLGLKRRQ